eukprot:1138310-Pelagomonas_calceolata.AAC.2
MRSVHRLHKYSFGSCIYKYRFAWYTAAAKERMLSTRSCLTQQDGNELFQMIHTNSTLAAVSQWLELYMKEENMRRLMGLSYKTRQTCSLTWKSSTT